MLAESGSGDGREARAFFAAEYRMNVEIKRFPKPVLALMDGITMGGGVGLSVHGTHRIATERTVFAMPETGIGLFPDVGGGWFLPRLRGRLGTWLALTGARLKGLDVAAARVATHFLPSEILSNLKKQVLGADYSGGAAEMLGEILAGSCHAVPAGSFEAQMDTIQACFGFDTAEEIVAALNNDGSDWAKQQNRSLVDQIAGDGESGAAPASRGGAARDLRRKHGHGIPHRMAQSDEPRFSGGRAGRDHREGQRPPMVAGPVGRHSRQ